MEFIDVNGTKVQAEVLTRAEDGSIRSVNVDGVVLLHRDALTDAHVWVRAAESNPLQAARELLEQNYWSDVKEIAEEAKDEIARGRLDTKDAVERFIHESVDGSYRLNNTDAQREVFAYTRMGQDEVEEWWGVEYSAYAAFRADVYEELGDVDELLAEAEAAGEEDEHDPT
jgi:hypothetical protein